VAIAAIIAGVGRVTVSERKSIIAYLSYDKRCASEHWSHFIAQRSKPVTIQANHSCLSTPGKIPGAAASLSG
jgi:hypothetical protein